MCLGSYYSNRLPYGFLKKLLVLIIPPRVASDTLLFHSLSQFNPLCSITSCQLLMPLSSRFPLKVPLCHGALLNVWLLEFFQIEHT